MTTLREAAQQALEAMNYSGMDVGKFNRINAACVALRAALAEPTQEPVAFITPLMEQQMFDDWCPYKGNPDPRTVWAAAVESMNGLLLGASQPQRKPLTREEAIALWADKSDGPSNNEIVSYCRAVEAAHGIGSKT